MIEVFVWSASILLFPYACFRKKEWLPVLVMAIIMLTINVTLVLSYPEGGPYRLK